MTNNSFFNEQKEQSLVKARIVEKYFWAWAKVIIPTAKKAKKNIAYIDLFAGPGRYQDGSASTPLKVLESAINDPDMQQMLVTKFNDLDSNNVQSLQTAIESIPNINKLKHKPEVLNQEIGENMVKTFENMNLVPTLFFVDPWGYKGLSLRLINSVVKNWGCDCIFFFNYNRINMGLSNFSVREHMEALFGEKRAEELSIKLESLSPYQRELNVVEAICQALKEMGGQYVLPFRFKHESGQRTSHHLIFVSKHPKGYEIMKDIMAKSSFESYQGVPSFEYNPATSEQPLLFEYSRPLDDLKEMLLQEFSGKTLTMLDVYNLHNIDKPYIKKNYKDVLIKLECEGKIIADPPSNKRRKLTFGDTVKVKFPPE